MGGRGVVCRGVAGGGGAGTAGLREGWNILQAGSGSLRVWLEYRGAVDVGRGGAVSRLQHGALSHVGYLSDYLVCKSPDVSSVVQMIFKAINRQLK